MIARTLYGDADQQAVRAFFRVSVLQSHLRETSSVGYPRLKITHPEIFSVLIDVYAEFADEAKLQELIDLVYQ